MRIMLTLQVDVDLPAFAESKGCTHERDAAGYAVEYIPAAVLRGVRDRLAGDDTEGVTVTAVGAP